LRKFDRAASEAWPGILTINGRLQRANQESTALDPRGTADTGDDGVGSASALTRGDRKPSEHGFGARAFRKRHSGSIADRFNHGSVWLPTSNGDRSPPEHEVLSVYARRHDDRVSIAGRINRRLNGCEVAGTVLADRDGRRL
jgi:hypothetical protein